MTDIRASATRSPTGDDATGDNDLAAFALLPAFRRRQFQPDQEVIREGDPAPHAYALVSGWAFSYRLLADGTRQVLAFHIPGDMPGLADALLGRSSAGCKAATPIVANSLPAYQLRAALTHDPGLAAPVLRALSREAVAAQERMVDLGRRSAVARTVHMLLELGERLQRAGMAVGNGYACPISQILLADALGLSAIHLNRVLRRLREDGVLRFRAGHVVFDDPARARRLALSSRQDTPEPYPGRPRHSTLPGP
ncbi:hypothetical protein KBTX_03389 [wastewater metagenome]|uniref:HTH crp-type domain-containing protein n=2 Tax=unclassified sequences TaxID=12908 RepID=A0A5B8RJ08_9ZZZZ|nr:MULTISPECIES: Crp/Fnr family transcriptional regulator [Arhodomonas]QEA07045.1 hypothetical protein KBTEX_03389 [uncultured organism]